MLQSSAHSGRILRSSDEEGKHYPLLFGHEMKLKEEPFELKLSYTIPCTRAFATLSIVEFAPFLSLQPSVSSQVPCACRILLSSCVDTLRRASVRRQDTREGKFSQEQQEMYEGVVRGSGTEAVGTPVLGW